ncbi:hypothetical protein SERLADRAFT_480175 [Serpula lacrymans var. lacrymans S7.9]|uniref:Uncharacterized protein n=1 Tax=Serpula lacrymans var. lacrymans (strain S7.9) TaxID=578457 RepID=F8PCS7_SERL9|nr:uncharacterized protein SERLADRAFT_480175 [Serpula lacrymans var. lacrymans S7.9]EGO19026.1 hypothetical protein SERLADRAFT_480175 [Serpula lacrymans var. lacrymans S7.9]
MPVNNCTVSTTPPGALHTSDRSDGIEIVMQAADNLQPDSVKFPSQQSLRSDVELSQLRWRHHDKGKHFAPQTE